MKNQPLFVFFGHHKCASSWIQRIVWNLTADCGFEYRKIGRLEVGDEARIGRELADAPGLRSLGLPNARWEMVGQLPDFNGFHVVRDPRDMLVSAYFSHVKSHRIYPNTPAFYVEHRERLQKASLEEGLMLELDGPMKEVFGDMAQWRPSSDRRIVEVKMEDLTGNPAATFRSILEQTGRGIADAPYPAWWFVSRSNQLLRRKFGKAGIPREQVDRKSIEWHTGRLAFSKITGRKPGEEDSSSHLRKGTPGDWRNHFWGGLGHAFQERYGTLLEAYGYEPDEGWLRELPERAPVKSGEDRNREESPCT